MSEPPKLFSDDIAAQAPSSSATIDAVDANLLSELDLSSSDAVKEFFELDKVIRWINDNGYRRVALQLPDTYLAHAFQISQQLESAAASAKVYVLGDTSYRNCCIDDVAAEHANCDSLVHFGDACLSAPSSRIPLLYIFCNFKFDFDDFEVKLKSTLERSECCSNIALVYDSFLIHSAEKLAETVAKCVPSSVNIVTCHASICDGKEINKTSNEFNESSSNSFGREIPEEMLGWENATLIFIGSEKSPLLPLWLMTYLQFSDVIHYVPGETKIEQFQPNSNRQLRRRLFLIEKLRDAGTVGLVVGTLAVRGFKEAIARIRQLCKTAGKKLYVFSIGKLNEAKLSNFATDIDVFVLLSCPFGIVLSNEFFKPIVSFFEAEIALNPSKSWYSGNGWTAQFESILSDDIGNQEEETTDVSLITGKMRVTNIDAVETTNDRREVIQYTAGDYFANRTWKGLNDEHSEGDNVTVKEGLSGIAAGYTTEQQ
ncbi:putative diphthamide synthesis protein domain-containing protein [Ditylenchus destructor]|uniref:2-(3-amino-3-carboxypropyl)histidine synthase subunit 2 n=1 Tax=Ditylenchus destructor TaxID=166010 RepID=A0AAD4R4U5_9BILA|nr:putative diphthamide synthesis protein domain-containing protein [Ditylenchus destructor]